jgi:hypothetical protein
MGPKLSSVFCPSSPFSHHLRCLNCLLLDFFIRCSSRPVHVPATGHFLHQMRRRWISVLLAGLLIGAAIVIVVLRPDKVGVVAAADCMNWVALLVGFLGGSLSGLERGSCCSHQCVPGWLQPYKMLSGALQWTGITAV